MNLVVMPTYNECDNIEPMVKAVLAYPWLHMLVVDDSSPDGTAERVRTLMAGAFSGRLFLLERSGKLGLGTAYLAGFRWALERNYEAIFEMDADFSHNTADLPRLNEALATADLVIGSRYVKGGGVENWGVVRRILSMGGSLYARIILNLPVRDVTGGFKAFRRTALESLALERVRSNGYSFQVEMNYRAYQKGLRIQEIPIIFADRRVGASKMNRRIILEAVQMVWQLRWSALRGRL